MPRIHRLFAAVAAAAFAWFSQAADLTIAYQTGIDPTKVLWLNDSGHPDRALSFAQP